MNLDCGLRVSFQEECDKTGKKKKKKMEMVRGVKVVKYYVFIAVHIYICSEFY